MSNYLEKIFEEVKFDQDLHTEIFQWNKERFFAHHWHPAVEIIYCLQDCYRILGNQHEYVLQKQDIAFIKPGIVHALYAPKNGKQLFCLADLSIFQEFTRMETLISLLPPITIIRYTENTDLNLTISHFLKEMERENSAHSPFYEMSIYSNLMNIMTVLGRSKLSFLSSDSISNNQAIKYNDLLLYVCDYIHEHCTENLSLDEVASLAGFSKYHFTRLFKEFTGDTFYKYLNKKRITYAECLLTNSDLSVTEIANNTGYSSLPAFIRMFKQITGFTPTQFRSIQVDSYHLDIPGN